MNIAPLEAVINLGASSQYTQLMEHSLTPNELALILMFPMHYKGVLLGAESGKVGWNDCCLVDAN